MPGVLEYFSRNASCELNDGRVKYVCMQTQSCEVTATPTKLTWQRLLLGLGAVVATYWLLQVSGILTFSPQVAGATNLGAVFVVGLVAALSSCTAMVTGVVAAVSATQVTARAHAFFNLGRLFGFAGFGAVIGLLGQVLRLSIFANGLMVLAIALFMITLGAHLMRLLPRGVWYFSPPARLTQAIASLSTSRHPAVPLILGALTFFLPCGFTQSMQLYALSTGSPWQAAIIMTVFALGTLPSFVGIGLLTSSVKGVTKRRLNYLVGAMVIALGVANLQNGATLLGWAGFTPHTQRVSAASVLLPDGSQRVEMEITGQGYSPKTIEVIEDIPVTWEIYGTEQLGCANTLVAPTFNITTAIEPGFNQVHFTPTEPGTYVFSCSMGMVRGTMIVREKS